SYLSYSSFFFYNANITTQIYPLSLHDALPISTPPRSYGHVAFLRLSHGRLLRTLVEDRQACANLQAAQDLLRQLVPAGRKREIPDRKSTRLNSSHVAISYAVFCLKKKKKK